ncbi:MAG: antibiotic biosynthesis monooxygenase [Acidobacteriota bacterium]
MVLEAVTLHIRSGQSGEFEAAFNQAQPIIASMEGYISHDLQRCVEVKDQYLLLVRWRTIEDHTVGFRAHPDFAEWKRLLHHFYDPAPVIQHYEQVAGSGV